MIDRYTRPEMGRIFSLENKFEIWKEIEVLACEAQAELGVIPRDEVAAIRTRAHFDVERIEEIERETNHDVIAFLTNMAEHIGEPEQVGPLRHDVERPGRHGALLPDDAGAGHRHRGRPPARSRSARGARSSSRTRSASGARTASTPSR